MPVLVSPLRWGPAVRISHKSTNTVKSHAARSLTLYATHRVLRKVVREVARLNLVCKQVFLVEEKDDRRVVEKFVVTDPLEEFQTLVYPVHFRFMVSRLANHCVIPTEGSTVQDRSDVIEAVDPLLPF